MPEFTIEVRGEAREVYRYEAADEAEARRIFEEGRSGPPEITEVEGAEIVSVVKEDI